MAFLVPNTMFNNDYLCFPVANLLVEIECEARGTAYGGEPGGAGRARAVAPHHVAAVALRGQPEELVRGAAQAELLHRVLEVLALRLTNTPDKTNIQCLSEFCHFYYDHCNRTVLDCHYCVSILLIIDHLN